MSDFTVFNLLSNSVLLSTSTYELAVFDFTDYKSCDILFNPGNVWSVGIFLNGFMLLRFMNSSCLLFVTSLMELFLFFIIDFGDEIKVLLSKLVWFL